MHKPSQITCVTEPVQERLITQKFQSDPYKGLLSVGY